MVERRLSDGTRIAQLLASEVEGLGGPLDPASVVDAAPDVEPTPDGAFAYAVAIAPGGEPDDEKGNSDEEHGADRKEDDEEHGADEKEDEEHGTDQIAAVFVQPERVRVEFSAGQQLAAEAAEAEGLRVRPKASRPPRTLLFVEDGAEVKRASRVFEAVVAARE